MDPLASGSEGLRLPDPPMLPAWGTGAGWAGSPLSCVDSCLHTVTWTPGRLSCSSGEELTRQRPGKSTARTSRRGFQPHPGVNGISCPRAGTLTPCLSQGWHPRRTEYIFVE